MRESASWISFSLLVTPNLVVCRSRHGPLSWVLSSTHMLIVVQYHCRNNYMANSDMGRTASSPEISRHRKQRTFLSYSPCGPFDNFHPLHSTLCQDLRRSYKGSFVEYTSVPSNHPCCCLFFIKKDGELNKLRLLKLVVIKSLMCASEHESTFLEQTL